MAYKKQVLILLFSLLPILSSIVKPSYANTCPASITIPGGEIGVYWGQYSDSGEGTLTETCDSGLYNIVALAYLHVFGDSSNLDLSDHCPSGDCTFLAPQIQHCQDKGIKVFLSIEVDSEADPNSLGSHLYDRFLSGKPGPLGPVTLDGIDITHIEQPTVTEQWEELVKAISGSTQERKIYISGAPLCPTTSGLDSAIETGLFDYLWVSYYGEWKECEYIGNGFNNLLESWATWTSKPGLAKTSLFLGLVASEEPAAASNGYITPQNLKSYVLPDVTASSNFGGVMLWNRYYDKKTGYSTEIKDDLGTKTCTCVPQVAPSKRFNSLLTMARSA